MHVIAASDGPGAAAAYAESSRSVPSGQPEVPLWRTPFTKVQVAELSGQWVLARLQLALPGSDAIASGMAARVLDAICDRPVAVWFSDSKRKMLMHPENDVAELVLSGSAPPMHLADEVAAWRAQYAAFLA